MMTRRKNYLKEYQTQELIRMNKWIPSAILVLKIALPIVFVLALINLFFSVYMLRFNWPIEVIRRTEQFRTQIDFYEKYGPHLEETDTTPTPTPTPFIGIDLTPLRTFDAPDDIKELVMIFANRTNTPPAFAMGILLTENPSFNPNAIHTNIDGSQDCGLWQLNGVYVFDPLENTERAARILNTKKGHLRSAGIQAPSLGLLAESYNKGAMGAISLLYAPASYARKALGNAGIPVEDDPFARDPHAYMRQL